MKKENGGKMRRKGELEPVKRLRASTEMISAPHSTQNLTTSRRPFAMTCLVGSSTRKVGISQ